DGSAAERDGGEEGGEGEEEQPPARLSNASTHGSSACVKGSNRRDGAEPRAGAIQGGESQARGSPPAVGFPVPRSVSWLRRPGSLTLPIAPKHLPVGRVAGI